MIHIGSKPKIQEEQLVRRSMDAANKYIEKIGMSRAGLADKATAMNHFFSGFYAGVRFTEDYPELLQTDDQQDEVQDDSISV